MADPASAALNTAASGLGWRRGTSFFSFVQREAPGRLLPIALFTLISAIANSFVLIQINVAADGGGSSSIRVAALFAFALALYLYTKFLSLQQASFLVEAIVRSLRVRLVDKLRHCELLFVERLSRSQIYSILTQETQLISQSVPPIINGTQAAILLFFCAIYIAVLSLIAFTVVVLGMLSISAVFYANRATMSRLMRSSLTKEAEFFSSLGHMLDGFKYLKLHQGKSEELFASYDAISYETMSLNQVIDDQHAHNLVFSTMLYYILVGVIAFILPALFAGFRHDAVQIVVAILFIIAPLTILLNAIPIFQMTAAAIAKIYELDNQLDQEIAASAIGEAPATEAAQTHVKSLELDQVLFHYNRDDPDGFTLGPLSLAVAANQILFIVGGNGSGKTTLLKVITGLYQTASGRLLLNGQALRKQDYPSYRQLFSGVFADFHIFDRLYGLPLVDPEHVNRLLTRVGLGDKVTFADGRFSRLDLSLGQLKRLAFVIALLEDRPIYVFDEWAAEQDPDFKRIFYRELLQELKAVGKTIIAISHDDRYLDAADRVVNVEFGAIITDKRKRSPPRRRPSRKRWTASPN